MITRLEAYRYRCFQTLDLALDQQHVFAGSNGSGKTTLLDIPALLGDLVRVTNINDAFFTPVNSRARSRAEEAKELIHNFEGDNFTLAIEALIPDIQQALLQDKGPKRFRENPETRADTIRYEISFKVVSDLLEVTEEHLLLFNSNNRPVHGGGIQGGRLNNEDVFPIIERNWRQKAKYRFEWQAKRDSNCIDFALQDDKLALGAMPADEVNFPAAFWFLNFLKQGTHCYEPQWPAMRMAASPRDKYTFKANGSSLPWQVWELQERDSEALAGWVEIVRMALPTIQTVEAKTRIDDSHCYLVVTYQNGIQVPSSGMSHGTLHILALTIIPFINNAPNIITLEEPENGIHPKAIEAVLEGLEITNGTQLFLSTHSPVVLANTDLNKIIIMRIDSAGATEVLKGDEHPALKEWKGGIDLGSLFAAGILD